MDVFQGGLSQVKEIFLNNPENIFSHYITYGIAGYGSKYRYVEFRNVPQSHWIFINIENSDTDALAIAKSEIGRVYEFQNSQTGEEAND